MAERGMTLEKRYALLEPSREPFLNRARRCSELTIPTLIPPEGHGPSTVYYTPWQGIGARGVNNLASKLLLSQLPPNSPFFRLQVDDFSVDALAGKPGGKAIVDEGLAKVERAIMYDIEASNARSQVFLALKHLIVGGNSLVVLPQTGVRVFRFDSFVVKRDVMGNVIDCIAKEEVSPWMLSTEEQALLAPDLGDRMKNEQAQSGGTNDRNNPDSPDKTVKLFTRWFRTDPALGPVRWRSYQELNGRRVPGSQGVWPIDKPPFIALRWNTVEGEDYGRSYVEEYLGDLVSLEGLSKAIVQGSAVAARIVYLLNPNGVTKLEDVTKAENGDVIIGKGDDVVALQSQKQADLTIAHQAAQAIQERLSQAFLMHSSVQRQAERVTAEEVRYMAAELEDALGGVYSILAQEFQLPFVTRIMDRMTKAKKLPTLPKGVVKPVIVTGLEALGRGHDLQKYNSFMQIVSPLGPEVIAQYINPQDYLSRIATALGIDPEGLIKSETQIAQERKQLQEAQMVQMAGDIAGKAAPAMVKGMSDKGARMDEAAVAQAQ